MQLRGGVKRKKCTNKFSPVLWNELQTHRATFELEGVLKKKVSAARLRWRYRCPHGILDHFQIAMFVWAAHFEKTREKYTVDLLL